MFSDDNQVIYILTLRLDPDSQAFFDRLRLKYFPPERNYLKAHLTLFHQLPDADHTFEILRGLTLKPFNMKVNGLRHLGNGVAYQIESEELQQLQGHLSTLFAEHLIPQDKQGFKPHITIQNKVTPEVSKQLLLQLRNSFDSFLVSAIGLDLWIYEGGPWKHQESFEWHV